MLNHVLDVLQGLHPILKAYTGLLFAVFIYWLAKMGRQYRAATRELTAVNRAFHTLPALAVAERTAGQSLETINRMQEVAAKLPSRGAAIWAGVEQVLEKYSAPDSRRDGFFVTRSLDEVMPADAVISRYYRASTYHNVPGILTSLGLLGTFLALLFGLSELRVTEAGGVAGIGNLINNLSGKFVTSVVALFLSVVFLWIDVFLLQPRLRQCRDVLLRTLSARLPYLTPSRILLDIQRQSVAQARSLSNISADFVDKFTTVFHSDLAPAFAKSISTSMASQLQADLGPTLDGLTRTMGELTATVSRLETSKQESVVGELRGLTQSLESSLRTTLTEMGAQFREALAGSTQDQFGELANVVQGSAGVLQSMTSSFASMEATLKAIVDEARTSTTQQMTASVEQTTRLNQLVEGLMVRLNDTANENFEQIGAVLTTVVARLSDKVNELSRDMAATVQAATKHSQDTATATLQQAGQWSNATGQQLTTLLSTLQAKSVEYDRAGQALLAAQRMLEQTLSQNQQALQAFGHAAGQVKSYSEGLAGQQRKLDEGQQLQMRLATLTEQSVAKLVDAAREQDAMLGQYKATFEKYQGVFQGLDQELDRVLSTIVGKMDQYNRNAERNFEALLKTANQYFPDIASTLKDANADLREQLEELTETLTTGVAKLKSA